MCSPNTYAYEGVFNPNIPIFASYSAEGLHFSAFHFIISYIYTSNNFNITFQNNYVEVDGDTALEQSRE